jgi:chromosome segregation ATPase
VQARARKEASEAARLKREMEKKIEMYEELRKAFDEERGNLKGARGEVEDLNRKLEEAGREIKEIEGRLARSQGRCKELEGMVQVRLILCLAAYSGYVLTVFWGPFWCLC